MCLQTSPTSSLQIDMAPCDRRQGKILLMPAKDEPYNKEETLHSFPFALAREATVANVLGAINDKGRDAFWFSVEEEGCRWWMCQLMSDFENLGLVATGSATAAKESLLRYRRNPESSELRDMRLGNFGSTPNGEEDLR